MRHRGPHGAAHVVREDLIIAANRLAIRGVDQPQPPLVEHDGGVIMACNGEIDNHRALRKMLAECGHAIAPGSDVAVIAPLYLEYGLDFLKYLQGVFALALWDARCRRLVLARDRGGERHLYYSVTDHRVTFASELAALLAALDVPVQTDARVLAKFLQSGYCASPCSPVRGVRKIGPGEVVVIDQGGVRRRRYWNFPVQNAVRTWPSPQVFDGIFRAAVERQSDVDVDYGVLLSGGVDSALISAVLRSVRPGMRLPAYCIRFGEASYDEGSHAERIARDLGCGFVPVTVSAVDVPGALRGLVHGTGELLADPAWIPMSMVVRRASEDVRVLLAGEGADELFGGYPTYLGARWAGQYARLPRRVRATVKFLVEALPASDKKVPVSFLLKRFVWGQDQDAIARHLLWTSAIAPEWLRRLGVEPPAEASFDDAKCAVDAAQKYDFEHSLPDALMAKADRAGMLHGVEIRAPFLDQTVIEFAAALPVEARIRGLTTKPFLKRYALGYLPRAVVTQRKRGLSVPLSIWLRGPLHEWARTRLSHAVLGEVGIDTGAALNLLSEHRMRHADHARAIWTLIVLSEWLEWLHGRVREGGKEVGGNPTVRCRVNAPTEPSPQLGETA